MALSGKENLKGRVKLTCHNSSSLISRPSDGCEDIRVVFHANGTEVFSKWQYLVTDSEKGNIKRTINLGSLYIRAL